MFNKSILILLTAGGLLGLSLHSVADETFTICFKNNDSVTHSINLTGGNTNSDYWDANSNPVALFTGSTIGNGTFLLEPGQLRCENFTAQLKDEVLSTTSTFSINLKGGSCGSQSRSMLVTAVVNPANIDSNISSTPSRVAFNGQSYSVAGLNRIESVINFVIMPPPVKMTVNQQNSQKLISTLMIDYFCGNSWSGLQRWQQMNAAKALLGYTEQTSDTNFLVQTAKVMANSGIVQGNIDDQNDDAGWAALALLNYYSLTGDSFYLNQAKDVYIKMHSSWDNVCNGGIWWGNSKSYKNAISNELYITLTSTLYLATKKPMYLSKALEGWQWFANSGLINPENLINDGLNEQCENNGKTTWTYNQGVILSGLTNLYMITGKSEYLHQAYKIARAVIVNLTTNDTLREPTLDMDLDQQQFKGIFMSNLAYLLKQSDPETVADLITFIQTNQQVVWSNSRSSNDLVNAIWGKNPVSWVYTSAAQSSAIMLMIATF